MKKWLAAAACLFLAAHLPFLPPNLEDIDSVNFALGVRDFDVARHQPHPPGYPVYIALGKVSTALFGGAENPRAIVRGLSIWSVIGGAALVVLLFGLFRALAGSDRVAWWAMGIAVASPLFWFSTLRPLSDMTGLAVAVAAQALVVAVLTGRTARDAGTVLVIGAFVAGLAAGVRVQTVLLTVPILAAALILPNPSLNSRRRLAALISFAAAVLLWGVPLLFANGGIDGYLAALGTQAGEDFSGVVMLWTTRSARVALNAFLYSFLWPWGSLVLGAIVLLAAVIGTLRLGSGDPQALLWLALAFGPYAIFHLLFHETLTVRYALPLVIPVAFLVGCAFDWAGGRVATVSSVAVIAICLVRGVRAVRGYGTAETPAFQALRAVSESASRMPIGMHAAFRRISEWQPPGSTLVRPPHGREWLALVERWRSEPDASMAFVSDPRRTDLALFDPHARQLEGSYRWTFPQLPYVGGLRPGEADWYAMAPPGWMLDRGWALSAEIGGVSARDAAGPHLQPSIAWVRGRGDAPLLMIGGRNLTTRESTELIVSCGDAVIDRGEIKPGFFFKTVPLREGILAGSAYVPLSVRSTAGPQVGVSLEQFDLQSDGVEMAGYMEGWYEPEYNPSLARAWRWMSERAVLWVRPIGRDVTLTFSGESPMRYFDSAPGVRVSLGGQELARFSPSADFTQDVRLPAPLLEANGGRVVFESTQFFVPAERGESPDPRHLALRVYGVSVR